MTAIETCGHGGTYFAMPRVRSMHWEERCGLAYRRPEYGDHYYACNACADLNSAFCAACDLLFALLFAYGEYEYDLRY